MTAREVRSVTMQELVPAIMQAMQDGGSAELTVTGRSMTPLLRDRVSRVRLAAVSQPKRGDMVLYRRQNGAYVLHRIAAIGADGTYMMCGDAQTVLEPGIRREQLLAVVTDFEPHVAEEAVAPTHRAGPSYVRNTVIGALVLALLVYGVYVVRYLYDDSIRTEEDMEKYFGVTPLAIIPQENDNSDGEGKRAFPKKVWAGKEKQK